MENKIEYKILDDKITIYFYGELSCSNIYIILLSLYTCTNIGLVLGRYNQLNNEKRKLVLANLSKTSYKVFELSGMFDLMEYVEGVKE